MSGTLKGHGRAAAATFRRRHIEGILRHLTRRSDRQKVHGELFRGIRAGVERLRGDAGDGFVGGRSGLPHGPQGLRRRLSGLREVGNRPFGG